MLNLTAGKSYGYGGEITAQDLKDNSIEQIDVLSVDIQETNVKELRVILALTQEKPFGHLRLLWLQHCYNVSEIIQNTLLKIVEEPPSETVIVLQTKNGADLLPTLRSRLHFIRIGAEKAKVIEPTFPDTVSEIGKLLTAVKDREALRVLLLGQINYLRTVILENPATTVARQIKLLNICERRLKQNCNQKLVVDQLLLHWNV